MAKIEQEQKKFKPYKIVVETKEEHEFLQGLFQAVGKTRKVNCIDFNTCLDHCFFNLIRDLRI